MSRDGKKGLFSMMTIRTKDTEYTKEETESVRYISFVARKVLRYTQSWHTIIVLVSVRRSPSCSCEEKARNVTHT
jgi:hypothetical protein